jgi:hypothetical protein
VFGLGAATRIYLAVGATDIRKGFNVSRRIDTVAKPLDANHNPEKSWVK